MQILFHDNYFVAVNKPPGLLVHRSRIDRHETRFAMQITRDLIKQRVYPVHRLDKPTSGVLLFALRPEAATNMMRLYENSQVFKTYLAVVRGYTAEQGKIDYALREEPDKMTDALAEQNKAAQVAVTEFERLATVELAIPVGRYQLSRYSLIKVTPHTGRKHQIRRHMKHIFHPIIGDTTHGDGKHNKMFRQQFNCHRLLLHAWRMSFTHPYTNSPVVINAPLDTEFENLLDRFGWGDSLFK